MSTASPSSATDRRRGASAVAAGPPLEPDPATHDPDAADMGWPMTVVTGVRPIRSKSEPPSKRITLRLQGGDSGDRGRAASRP